MRVLIDTNILISAALSIGSTPYQAYVKAVTSPNHGIVCDQNIDELKRVFARKFPKRMDALDHFLAQASTVLEIVPTPTNTHEAESSIRDLKDRPILRAAIAAKADVLLTGDRDFTESGIQHPLIMTAAQFLVEMK